MDLRVLTDEILLRLLKADDKTAFKEIYSIHLNHLQSYFQPAISTIEQQLACTNAPIIIPNQQIYFNLSSIIKLIAGQPGIINASTGKNNTPPVFIDIPATG